MCSCSSAAWLWAGPLLLLLLCSHTGTVAGRPQAQERTEGQEKQQAQQVQQRQQGTEGQQGQQGQQFFPLLALIGTRWYSQLSRQQQQRQQQQQQQQQTVTTLTTTTITTSSLNAAIPPAAAPLPAMTLPMATAPVPTPAVLTAAKPAVPAGDVLILDTPAPAGPAADAPTPATVLEPAMVGADMPAPQQQQQQQQEPPAAVNMVPATPLDQTNITQPDFTWEDTEFEDPAVDEAQGYEEDWPEDATAAATEQPAAAAAAAAAPAPQAPLAGRSATGPRGNLVPGSLSAAKVQSPRVVPEAGPSGRPVAIPVKPLSGVPRNSGQQPRRRRRQPASPAAVPAIMPLTEVLTKQQEQLQLQGQSVGA